ncbi:hypothetical protein [Schwartzia succinivorans]|uniref:hypothetical protein n=1 Tax=Schwartzia succinivorans TaxID=55507 RepID=UPI002353B371|nr:hypothetical protein [Schwartzia succinivorans]
MLSFEQVKKLYDLEIGKYQGMIKEGCPVADIANEKLIVELIGHILEFTPEEIFRDMNS